MRRVAALFAAIAIGVPAGFFVHGWSDSLASTQQRLRPVYAETPRPKAVHMKHLRPQPSHAHPNLPRPDEDRMDQAPASTNEARRTGVVAPSPVSPSSGAAAQASVGFPVMDLHRQVALYPADQIIQPPDTQLAAGPVSLAEAVNSTLSVWTKSGALVATADMNAFFPVPVGYTFSDPRIFYDATSGRWLLSGLSFDKVDDSEVYLAVSSSSDPTGSWHTYVLASDKAVLHDQPMIASSVDKLVISWNDFSGGAPPATPVFLGAQTWVLQRSDLLAGTPAATAKFGPDTTRARLVPAIATSATSTSWLVYDGIHCSRCPVGTSAIGVVAINGTPAAGDVAWTETDPHSPTTHDPPPPRQPSGIAVTAQIGDAFTSAVFQNGTLWMSGNDACVPAGDSATRACLRLIRASTVGTPSVSADFDVGANGLDLYYPAVAVDLSANLFVAFSESSSTMYPSAIELHAPAGQPMSPVGTNIIAAGQTSYLLGAKNRWGDYSAAAVDPSDPHVVWVTAEYQASAIDHGDWGTATFGARMPVQRTGAASQASPAPSPAGRTAPQSSPAPSPSPR